MNLEMKTMHQLYSIKKTAVFEVQLAEQLRALVALLGGQGLLSTPHVAIKAICNFSSR